MKRSNVLNLLLVLICSFGTISAQTDNCQLKYIIDEEMEELRIPLCEIMEKGVYGFKLNDGKLYEFKLTGGALSLTVVDSNHVIRIRGKYADVESYEKKPIEEKPIMVVDDEGNLIAATRYLLLAKRTATWKFYDGEGKLLEKKKY